MRRAWRDRILTRASERFERVGPHVEPWVHLARLSLTRVHGHQNTGRIESSGRSPRVESETPIHPPEFRVEAVRLYRTSDRGLKQISAELGIAPESLRRWSMQS